jgi:hypothetical protein
MKHYFFFALGGGLLLLAVIMYFDLPDKLYFRPKEVVSVSRVPDTSKPPPCFQTGSWNNFPSHTTLHLNWIDFSKCLPSGANAEIPIRLNFQYSYKKNVFEVAMFNFVNGQKVEVPATPDIRKLNRYATAAIVPPSETTHIRFIEEAGATTIQRDKWKLRGDLELISHGDADYVEFWIEDD